MIKRTLTILAAAAIAVSLTALGCAQTNTAEKAGRPGAAPDFTLTDLSGQQVSLSQFAGKKNVLLVFGATWCPYCVNEIPELKGAYQDYNDKGVEVLYVDIQESREKVSAFAKKNQIPYTVLLDTAGETAAKYNVYGIPHQVVITKDGNIAYEGPRPEEGIESLINRTIGMKGGSK
jgi:peroxiredoxin